MKHFITLSIIIAFLSSFTFRIGIDDVIAALKTGNASAVAKYFDNNVDISMPDKSNSYSKAQAILILKDFFDNNEVKTFEVKHKGDQNGGQFCVGTLQTKSGNYRTTIFMKTMSGKDFIKTLRFQSV